MSKHEVRFTVELTIKEGSFAAFETIVQIMIERTQKEIGTLGYEWHLSNDRKRCRLIETYRNADAVLVHMTGSVVQQLVPKLLETSSLNRFEVYGDPGPKAAEILTSLGAEIFHLWRCLGR